MPISSASRYNDYFSCWPRSRNAHSYASTSTTYIPPEPGHTSYGRHTLNAKMRLFRHDIRLRLIAIYFLLAIVTDELRYFLSYFTFTAIFTTSLRRRIFIEGVLYFAIFAARSHLLRLHYRYITKRHRAELIFCFIIDTHMQKTVSKCRAE